MLLNKHLTPDPKSGCAFFFFFWGGGGGSGRVHILGHAQPSLSRLGAGSPDMILQFRSKP